MSEASFPLIPADDSVVEHSTLAKPESFLGHHYFMDLARHAERDNLHNRLLTRHLGSTALGPLINRALPVELATRINSLTPLKIAHMVMNSGETISRISKERTYKKDWSDFTAGILEYAQTQPDFTVMQIGAYDGITNDRLHPMLMSHPNWRAILVEPMPQAFKRLERNYVNRPNTTLVEGAVVNQDGPVEMHHVVPDRHSPLFVDLTLTTKPKTLEVFREAGNQIDLTEVNGFTMQSLMDKLELSPKDIDFLFIDAEGCDYNILKQLLSGSVELPRFMVAEHDHMSENEYQEIVLALANQGYNAKAIAHDILFEQQN